MSVMTESLLELKHLLELITLLENKNDRRLDEIIDDLYEEFEFYLRWPEKIYRHCEFCKCPTAPNSRLDSILQKKKRLLTDEKRQMLRKTT